MKEIMELLPERVSSSLTLVDRHRQKEICEIRLRVNKPITVKLPCGEYGLSSRGLTQKEGMLWSAADSGFFWRRLCEYSPYVLSEAQKQGYVTVSGGHRIGLGGEIVCQEGLPKVYKHISAYCIRLAHEVQGCSNRVLEKLFDCGMLCSTLVVSPPGCGKTTLLRDICRRLSNDGFQCVLIDERSELAACVKGISMLDVGTRTDILSGIPKASGMLLAIRSLSPQAIITDEIGGKEDIAAVQEAARCGVPIIASVHALNLEQLKSKPKELLGNFQRFILLGDSCGVGTIEAVLDAEFKALNESGRKRCCI